MTHTPWPWCDRDYLHARWEHALLLRAEQFTLAEIAERLGCKTREGARLLVAKGARRLRWAIRRTRFHIVRGNGAPFDAADYRRMGRQIEWLRVKAEALSHLSRHYQRKRRARLWT